METMRIDRPPFISVGNKVTLRFSDAEDEELNEELETYVILNRGDFIDPKDPTPIMYTDSILGTLLTAGKYAAGDELSYEGPDGAKISVLIVSNDKDGFNLM